MTNSTQIARPLGVATPFGQDRLLLKRFWGHEQLSRLFEFELEMLSEDDDLQPVEIVGHRVTFRVETTAGEDRLFNGYVSRFGYAGTTNKHTVYRATVVPWLWLLTKTADCRIFQAMTAKQIIERVFSDLGFTDFELKELNGEYVEREYCVQYRETDFAFVSRLMEEEGIFYYFRHSEEGHTLMLQDWEAGYFDLPHPQVDFLEPDPHNETIERVLQWRHEYAFRPGRWAQTDFNFKTPSNSLMCQESSNIELQNNSNYEVYDYPGRYQAKGTGKQRTRTRIEEEEARHNIVRGKSSYRELAPGGMFKVGVHPAVAEQGKSYALTTVEHNASVSDTYDTAGEFEFAYENRFSCIPSSVPFRPEWTTPKPIVEGPQTAFIVGPPGEEIYPDEYGRVKVQFHWDREGKYDENSSCWMRVSQTHAGKGWGGIDLPRIGEEVIVDFLEGDPDRPIITGRVYNAESMPPFALPGEKTRSGMKSQTHKGSGFNEISMDDTAGKEQIRMNAQYNMDTAVGNNQTLIVNVDRTSSIGNNDSSTVGVDSTENVGNNKTVTIGNNLNINVGNKAVLNAGSSITLKCGASKIHMNSGGVITITGTIITMAAAANASVVAPLTQVVGGAMLTTVGGINMMSGGVCHVGAAALASVAGGKVDVASTGVTSIKGGLITLN